jgi:hypothetical protein
MIHQRRTGLHSPRTGHLLFDIAKRCRGFSPQDLARGRTCHGADAPEPFFKACLHFHNAKSLRRATELIGDDHADRRNAHQPLCGRFSLGAREKLPVKDQDLLTQALPDSKHAMTTQEAAKTVQLSGYGRLSQRSLQPEKNPTTLALSQARAPSSAFARRRYSRAIGGLLAIHMLRNEGARRGLSESGESRVQGRLVL